MCVASVASGQSTWAGQTFGELQEKTKVIVCNWAGDFHGPFSSPSSLFVEETAASCIV